MNRTLAYVLVAVALSPSCKSTTPTPDERPAKQLDQQEPAATTTPVRLSRFALGPFYTCFLADTGRIACWGNIGDKLPALTSALDGGASDVPRGFRYVPLPAERRALSLSGGSFHTCALLEGGDVACWGGHVQGQLGRRRTDREARLPVVDLGPERTASQLAAGSQFNCALLDDGSVRCWGSNKWGQLGIEGVDRAGSNPDEMGAALSRVPLPEDLSVESLWAGGNHACVTSSSAEVWCWGRNDQGQLGVDPSDTGPIVFTPRRVDFGSREASALILGAGHTCAVTSGELFCFGNNKHNSLGQPGDPAPYIPTPTRVDLGPADVVSGTASGGITCLLRQAGALACFGSNTKAQILGYLHTPGKSPPKGQWAAVDVGEAVVDVATGGGHTCARLSSGHVKCWGAGQSLKLGFAVEGMTTTKAPAELAPLAFPGWLTSP